MGPVPLELTLRRSAFEIDKNMMDKKTEKLDQEVSNGMEKIVSLSKRRGFVFPGS